MQEKEEEQEAKVCKRERGQPLQKQPQATEQGGGREKGIGRPAETKEHRTKSKNTNTFNSFYFSTFNWTVRFSRVREHVSVPLGS